MSDTHTSAVLLCVLNVSAPFRALLFVSFKLKKKANQPQRERETESETERQRDRRRERGGGRCCESLLIASISN